MFKLFFIIIIIAQKSLKPTLCGWVKNWSPLSSLQSFGSLKLFVIHQEGGPEELQLQTM